MAQFDGGIEGLVAASMDPNIKDGMAREHYHSADSMKPFAMPNGEDISTSAIEYRFVDAPAGGMDGKGTPFKPYAGREPLEYSHFELQLKGLNEQLGGINVHSVGRQEFVGLRA